MLTRLFVPTILLYLLPLSSGWAVEETGLFEVHIGAGTGGEDWSVSYEFPEPVERLVFERPAHHFRQQQWRLEGSAYRWDSEGEREALVLVDGAKPKSRLTLRVPVFTDHLEKEYEFFRRFSDGALLLYTGHLAGTASAADGESEFRVPRFHLSPRPGEHLVLAGRRHDGASEWVDPTGQGTYVYFGKRVPVTSPVMTAVLDPGLPDWLRERFETLLPRLFDWYTRKTGVTLEFKPTVYFSYDDADIAGLESGGGVLPRLIQLSVRGKGWEQASDQALEGLFQFLAHEAAHLWNGDAYRYEGDDHAWMHEGGADAFAFRALEAFEVVDTQRRWEKESEALNACALGLQGGLALADSADQGRFANYYACGTVIAVWTEAVVKAEHPDRDLFDFWRALFSASDGRYDEELYFAALEKQGVPQTAVANLRRFIVDGHADPATALQGLLETAGLQVAELTAPPPQGRFELARAVLKHLMGDDCAGDYSFSWEGDHFRTAKLDRCATLGGRRLVTVGGHSLVSDGHRAHDAAVIACQSETELELGLLAGDRLTLTCRKPLEPRAPYLGLSAE